LACDVGGGMSGWQGDAQPQGAVRWSRSSRCYTGSCVEVGICEDTDIVLVRDSKHPDARAIAVDLRDWAVFIDIVRDTCRGGSFNAVTAHGSAHRGVGARAAGVFGSVDCGLL
jgi:hypothetical protein